MWLHLATLLSIPLIMFPGGLLYVHGGSHPTFHKKRYATLVINTPLKHISESATDLHSISSAHLSISTSTYLPKRIGNHSVYVVVLPDTYVLFFAFILYMSLDFLARRAAEVTPAIIIITSLKTARTNLTSKTPHLFTCSLISYLRSAIHTCVP